MPLEQKIERFESNGKENNIFYLNELEKHFKEKVCTELLEKPTTKRISLIWSYGIHLKLLGDNLPLTGKRIGLIRTGRRKTYFTGRIKKNLGRL